MAQGLQTAAGVNQEFRGTHMFDLRIKDTVKLQFILISLSVFIVFPACSSTNKGASTSSFATVTKSNSKKPKKKRYRSNSRKKRPQKKRSKKYSIFNKNELDRKILKHGQKARYGNSLE